jgi:hypothetical protein
MRKFIVCAGHDMKIVTAFLLSRDPDCSLRAPANFADTLNCNRQSRLYQSLLPLSHALVLGAPPSCSAVIGKEMRTNDCA